jgi:hypothetical protein
MQIWYVEVADVALVCEVSFAIGLVLIAAASGVATVPGRDNTHPFGPECGQLGSWVLKSGSQLRVPPPLDHRDGCRVGATQEDRASTGSRSASAAAAATRHRGPRGTPYAARLLDVLQTLLHAGD